jgi:hypothetical protein
MHQQSTKSIPAVSGIVRSVLALAICLGAGYAFVALLALGTAPTVEKWVAFSTSALVAIVAYVVQKRLHLPEPTPTYDPHAAPAQQSRVLTYRPHSRRYQIISTVIGLIIFIGLPALLVWFVLSG